MSSHAFHGIGPPFDDFIRDHIEDIKDRKESLLVVLEIDGGSSETAERIADVFRHHRCVHRPTAEKRVVGSVPVQTRDGLTVHKDVTVAQPHPAQPGEVVELDAACDSSSAAFSHFDPAEAKRLRGLGYAVNEAISHRIESCRQPHRHC